MVCWHRKLLSIYRVPSKFFLQGKARNHKKKCPIHLDWGQSLQDGSRSNPEQMCQGGGIFLHPSSLSWWALLRSLCSQKNNIQDTTRWLLLSHSPPRCKKVYQPVWSMPKDGETYPQGWNASATSSEFRTIWQVGHGFHQDHWPSIQTKEVHHCVHRLLNKVGWGQSCQGSHRRKSGWILEGECVLQVSIPQRVGHWSSKSIYVPHDWEFVKLS